MAGRLMPLAQALNALLRRRGLTLDAPTAGDPEGARRMLEGMRGPLFPVPGRRMLPATMTDAQPVSRQVEPHLDTLFRDFGPGWPRPMESITPREERSLSEGLRIERLRQLYPDLFGQTAMN